jgi:hypothetical protein
MKHPIAGPFRSLPVLLAASALLVACDELDILTPEPWPEDFIVDGFWEGSVDGGWIEMTLSEDLARRTVTGMGVWIPDRVSHAFRVQGLVREEDAAVTLLLELSPPAPGSGPILVHFRGSPRGHRELHGQLNGGGFDQVRLVLRRPLTRPPET